MSRIGLSIETFGGKGIDVSEPVVDITIQSKSIAGKRKPKTTQGQSDQSVSIDSVTTNNTLLSNRLVAMKVVADTKRAMQAELTFWNEDQALNDTAIMQKGTLLRIAWGYVGYMGKTRTFKVHKIKGTTARVSNFGNVKVICLGQSFDLHGKVKSVCHCNTTPVRIARKMAKSYGFDDIDIILGPDEESIAIWHQVNETDAQFLKTLAQYVNFEFHVEDGIFYFAPGSKIDKRQPVAAYTYFTDKEGWIKRFEPESTTMGIPGSVTVKSRDPASGKLVQHTQTIKNKKEKSLCNMTELLPAVPFKPGPAIISPIRKVHRSNTPLKPGVVRTNQVVNSPGSTANQVKREATTRHDNALIQAVKARMVIIGDPDIWRGVLVLVEGVGKMMSGLHRVQKCTHFIDKRGYEVECKLRRDGVGTLGKNVRVDPDQKPKSQLVARRLRSRVNTRTKETVPKTTGIVSKTRFSRT